jgi:menaquinone-dependent protoporphyrinogen oxidase
MKVLIAVGSTYGSTRSIAERIAAKLEQSGCTATVQNVTEVTDLAPYDGIVLGGGVYRGQLHPGVMRLAQRNEAELAGKRTAAFSVSLIAAEPSAEKQAKAASFVAPLATLLSCQHAATFAGAWDPTSKPPLVRLVLKLLGAKPGDYRDWPAIENWAGELAATWA